MRRRAGYVLIHSISVLAVAGVAGLAGGCAAPAIAVTAGLTAAQAGTAAYVNGELREAAFADLAEVHLAVLRALAELEAPIVRERLDEQVGYIMARDRNGPEIRVTLRRRTPLLTRIDIRVGVLGDLAVSRVVLARINAQLDPIIALRVIESHAEQEGFTTADHGG